MRRQKERKSRPAPKPSLREKKVKPIPALTPAKPHEAHLEPKRDDMGPDLTNPQAFAARRKDQLDVDFEKIAMRRAQKQATFRRKEREEEAQWDLEHGGKFTYAGEHRPADKEMLDSEQHRALEAAFRRDDEDYEMKKLMKPAFDDFKLQFVSPHEQAQVEDGLPSEEANASEDNPAVAGDEIERPQGKVDFGTIAAERQATHASYAKRYSSDDGGRHQQRRLEELGIDFDSTFDLTHPPELHPRAKPAEEPHHEAAPLSLAQAGKPQHAAPQPLERQQPQK